MTDMGTRKPVRTPREAMEIIAGLWGVELDDDFDEKTPEARLHLHVQRANDRDWDSHEANVCAKPRLGEDKEGNSIITIEIGVSWSSSHYDAANAVLAAKVHTMAADAAVLAQSVAHGRTWDPEKVWGKGKT